MNYQNAFSFLRLKQENKFALVGPEQYLKEHFVKTAEKIYPEHTIISLFPEEQEEALSILRCESLFGDKFLVLNYFDEMKIKVFEDVIGSYIGNLILVLSSKANLKSRSMTKILSNVVVAECRQLREYGTDYPLWIRGQISGAGYTAPDEVDQLIFSRVGPSMYAISHELEKLFLVKLDDKNITPEDVTEIVSLTAVSTAFDLFESLLKRNVYRALDCFGSYAKSQDNFIEITKFLGLYFEKMYRILLLREKKMEANDIADIVNIPRFLVKTKYLPRAIAFGKNRIASKIDSICNLNIRLRLFKGDKKILFEKFILGFAQ